MKMLKIIILIFLALILGFMLVQKYFDSASCSKVREASENPELSSEIFEWFEKLKMEFPFDKFIDVEVGLYTEHTETRLPIDRNLNWSLLGFEKKDYRPHILFVDLSVSKHKQPKNWEQVKQIVLLNGVRHAAVFSLIDISETDVHNTWSYLVPDRKIHWDNADTNAVYFCR